MATVVSKGFRHIDSEGKSTDVQFGADGDNITVDSEKLTTVIDELKNTANIAHLHFGVCSTAAATAAKTVSISDFELKEGAEALVYIVTSNTAANPTLNISSTGAKSLRTSLSVGATGSIGKTLRAGLYHVVYYNNYYWVNSMTLVPSHGYVYGPNTLSTYSYNYGHIVNSSSFPVPNVDTLLLPGTYTSSAASTSVYLIHEDAYMKGYNHIDRKITAASDAFSVLNMTNPKVWVYSLYQTTSKSVVFEDIYFKLTSDTQYGILMMAYSSDSVVKFKNCVFELDCTKAFFVRSGHLEFENCSFFVTTETNSECIHIVEGVSSNTGTELSVSFNNCYVEGKALTDDHNSYKHIYLASLSGYHTRLFVTNCEIIECSPYKTEYSTSTSNASADCDISIVNNHIKTAQIGPYDMASSGYKNGCFIFSDNIWEVVSSNVGGDTGRTGKFVIHGGQESIINNNTILANGQTTFTYWCNCSSVMVNSFVGNTVSDNVYLGKMGSGQAYLTATGNTVSGTLTTATFTKTSKGYNATE